MIKSNLSNIQLQVKLFIDFERTVFRFMWKYKYKTVKTAMNNEKTTEGITIPDFKLFHRAGSIKQYGIGTKTRHIDQ